MIPDSIPFVLFFLTIFFAPVVYGRSRTSAVPIPEKETTK